MGQYKGKVMWFNNAKGFGFLSRDGEPDVFVHFSAIMADGYKTLREDEEVTYNVIRGEKGPQADDVRRVSKNETQSMWAAGVESGYAADERDKDIDAQPSA